MQSKIIKITLTLGLLGCMSPHYAVPARNLADLEKEFGTLIRQELSVPRTRRMSDIITTVRSMGARQTADAWDKLLKEKQGILAPSTVEIPAPTDRSRDRRMSTRRVPRRVQKSGMERIF